MRYPIHYMKKVSSRSSKHNKLLWICPWLVPVECDLIGTTEMEEVTGLSWILLFLAWYDWYFKASIFLVPQQWLQTFRFGHISVRQKVKKNPRNWDQDFVFRDQTEMRTMSLFFDWLSCCSSSAVLITREGSNRLAGLNSLGAELIRLALLVVFLGPFSFQSNDSRCGCATDPLKISQWQGQVKSQQQ